MKYIVESVYPTYLDTRLEELAAHPYTDLLSVVRDPADRPNYLVTFAVGESEEELLEAQVGEFVPTSNYLDTGDKYEVTINITGPVASPQELAKQVLDILEEAKRRG